MRSIAPQTPYGYTLFCDDIRQEIGNKVSLIGIYSGELIILGQLPIALPKLALRIVYNERPGESTEPVELRIYLPGDNDDLPSVKASIPLEKIRSEPIPAGQDWTDPVMTATLHTEIAPLQIKQEGFLKVRAYRGDLEIRLGALRISVRPPNTAQA